MSSVKVRGALWTIFILAPFCPALADTAFHVSEDIVEDEVKPRQAHHVTHWEGDFYVTDQDVTASGWGADPKDMKAIPFDQPTAEINRWGSRSVVTFHRIKGGIEVVRDYDSFVMTRRVVETGPRSCTMSMTFMLKPGHTLFEVHRRSNREPMFDARRDAINARCSPPKLLG